MINRIKNKIVGPEYLNREGNSFFLNPYSYLILRKHPELINAADYIFIDGQWLCHFLKWFRVCVVRRCSFDNSSAAPIVFDNANLKGLRVAIVGSDPKSASAFKNYLTATYPDINLVYARDGYFTGDEEAEAIQSIKSKNTDLVVVGMGVVRQEAFVLNLVNTGWKGQAYTCGGFMHQTASKGHDYYPGWVDKFNLRFLYRIWDEPKLLRRYTFDYAKFVALFVKDVLFSR